MTRVFATWRGTPVLGTPGIPVAALCHTTLSARERWARPGALAFNAFWFIHHGQLHLPVDDAIWRPWDGLLPCNDSYWLIMYREDLSPGATQQARRIEIQDVHYPNEADPRWSNPGEIAKLFAHMRIVP